MAEIDFAEMYRLIKPDFESGKLYWLPRPVEMFTCAPQCNRWNSRHAGKEALATLHHTGYFMGEIHAKMYAAHRVLWLLKTGVWPVGQIDHVNGVRSDNRFLNLREVTRGENMKNKRLSRNNASGVSGVHFNDKLQKWVASIGGGKGVGKVYLGVFTDMTDAVNARKAAEKELGFHRNHGNVLNKRREGLQAAAM